MSFCELSAVVLPFLVVKFMENPQLENGYVKIANEIVEALARTKLSSQESRILFAILRKTYGWNKKSDWISNSQLEEMTGIHRSHCANTVTRLKQRKLVTKTGNKIQFNKLFSQYSELPKQVTKQVTVTQTGTSVTQTGNQVLPKQVLSVTQTGKHKRQYTKDTFTKDTNTKEIASEARNDLNSLISLFEKINPTTNYGNKTQRKALEELVSKLGYEKTKRTIEYACSVQGKQYAPTITTPYQLKEKLSQLAIYYQKENSKPLMSKNYD